MIIRYIRENKTDKSKGNPIGIIIALDKDHIGWSLKNKKDKWNKDIGMKIARNRALRSFDIFRSLKYYIPILTDKIIFDENTRYYKGYHKVKPVYDRVKEIAEKYYKESI